MSLMSNSAAACVASARFDPTDVQYANTVVIGRIENYRIIRDLAARERWHALNRKLLAQPDIDAEFRKFLQKEPEGFLPDFARFDIVVAEVLAGTAPERLTVTWNNSTYGEPSALPDVPMMIALQDARSRKPPLRGVSAYISPAPDPDLPTVLQAPCADAFLFEAASLRAKAVRSAIGMKTRGDR
jgi:hypothetical protein